MATNRNLLLFLLWITFYITADASTTPSTSTPSTSSPSTSTSTPVTTSGSITSTPVTTSGSITSTVASTNLSCYDCNESFKYVWEPYTECQYYPMNAPLRPCLDVERYCKIERVTYKSLTVSITRGCTKECWHGCYASGFGLTKLKCTSCCLTPGCNIGDDANTIHTIQHYTRGLVLAICTLIVTKMCSL